MESPDDEANRIAHRRRQARNRLRFDGDTVRLVKRDIMDDLVTTPSSLKKEHRSSFPSPPMRSIGSFAVAPASRSIDSKASGSSEKRFRRAAESSPAAAAHERVNDDDALQLADIFCRDSVTLTIIGGFAHEGRLFGLGGDASRSHHARVYEGLSLHLEVGTLGPREKTSSTFSQAEQSDHGGDGSLRFYSPSTSRTQLALLLELSIAQVVRATKGNDPSRDDLWLDAVESPAERSEKPGVISLRVTTTSTSVRNKLERVIQASVDRCRRLRREDVIASAPTSRVLARDTLDTIRVLQRQTGQLLNDLRTEFALNNVTPDLDGHARGQKDIEDESHDAWVQRTVVRRHNLGEAQDELRKIQVRRKMRSDRVSRLVGADDVRGDQAAAERRREPQDTLKKIPSEYFSPSSVGQSGKSPLGDDIHQSRRSELQHVRSSTSLKRVDTSTRPRSAADDRKYLCNHCGESLQSRGEQRDHQRVCAYRTVRCRKCSGLIRAKEFSKHRETRCPAKKTSSLKRKSSNLSEVSSSSMEELGSDTVSTHSSGGLRRTSSQLQELPRSDSGGRWEDIQPSPRPTQRQASARRAQPTALSQEALRRHNSESPKKSELSRAFASHNSLRRTGSTLDTVGTRCVHCGRHAPSAHPARCAHRLVLCAVCGQEVKAKDALDHAELHRR